MPVGHGANHSARQVGIAVEGCGMVTPFAHGSGSSVLDRATAAHCRPEAAYWAIPDAFLDHYSSFSPELKRERGAWIPAVALTQACDDAGIQLPDFAPQGIALVLGCAFAGQLGMIHFAEEVRAQSARFVSPIHFPQTVGNYIAGALSRAFGIQGPNLTLSTGACAGLDAVSTACALLSDGAADIAIAGGTEVLSDDLVRGLGGSVFGRSNAGIWSEGACLYVLRPADRASAGKPRGIIPESMGRPGELPPCLPPEEHEGDLTETYCLTHLVGRSLAAESAMRLEAAIRSSDEPGRRTIIQVGSPRDIHTLVVDTGIDDRSD